VSTSLRHKELLRGKILYYLRLIYPQTATLQLLQAELDYFGYPIPMDELSFHIAYLAEKGFVEAERVRGSHTRGVMRLVKITAHGIDLLDARLAPDEGIYIEPKEREG
jgi:hypothetical protein